MDEYCNKVSNINGKCKIQKYSPKKKRTTQRFNNIFNLILFPFDDTTQQINRVKIKWHIEIVKKQTLKSWTAWNRSNETAAEVAFAKGEGDTFSVITFADASRDKSSRYIAR